MEYRVVNDRCGNERLVNGGIFLVEYYTFTDFSAALEVNIFSLLPKS